jgi:hypothetical protein
VAAAVVLVMALVVWVLERDTNPKMPTFGEALWWAIVTTTTVGYGDITPQTGLARLLATVLMMLGIGTVGVVASTVSAALLHVQGSDAPAEVPPMVDALERLAALRERGALTETSSWGRSAASSPEPRRDPARPRRGACAGGPPPIHRRHREGSLRLRAEAPP